MHHCLSQYGAINFLCFAGVLVLQQYHLSNFSFLLLICICILVPYECGWVTLFSLMKERIPIRFRVYYFWICFCFFNSLKNCSVILSLSLFINYLQSLSEIVLESEHYGFVFFFFFIVQLVIDLWSYSHLQPLWNAIWRRVLKAHWLLWRHYVCVWEFEKPSEETATSSASQSWIRTMLSTGVCDLFWQPWFTELKWLLFSSQEGNHQVQMISNEKTDCIDRSLFKQFVVRCLFSLPPLYKSHLWNG